MIELNIDGLPGPSHHYAGLAHGNMASTENAGAVSNPRGALLQGIAKMRLMLSLGVPQAVLPPHPRPVVKFLQDSGVVGKNIRELITNAPDKWLAVAYSSSAMWSANAATIVPSADAKDGRLHVTPANLTSNIHRALEAEISAANLKVLLPFATHHAPLAHAFPDEGAANHMRLTDGAHSLHLFVYGAPGKKFSARQSQGAAEQLAALVKTPAMVVEQSTAAIDAGVFHNDVIATSHANFLCYHEAAYAAPLQVPEWVSARRVTDAELTLAEAVATYFFNSQIVTAADGTHHFIAPKECEEHPRVRALLQTMPVSKVHFVDLKQSMKNGGGPACLRLRVPLTAQELAQVPQITTTTLDALEAFANTHYRDTLTFADLREPPFVNECYEATRTLYDLLNA